MIRCYEVACSKVTSNCILTYSLFHTLQSLYELLQCLYHLLLTVLVSLRTLYNLDAICLKKLFAVFFRSLFPIHLRFLYDIYIFFTFFLFLRNIYFFYISLPLSDLSLYQISTPFFTIHFMISLHYLHSPFAMFII